MINYIPRPGSKTEAAVNYLRAHGGAATAVALSDAIDTARKNLAAQLKAATERGLLEPCDLPDGMGYRLVGTESPGTPRTARVCLAPAPLPDAADWPQTLQPMPQRKPGVRKNPGRERLGATGKTSPKALAVAATATPRPKSERRGFGPAPTTAAAGNVAADPIHHPPHYAAHPSGIECIQIVEHMVFNVGNAIKHLWRADLKGSGIEDLRKAAWYIARELQRRERPATPAKESA